MPIPLPGDMRPQAPSPARNPEAPEAPPAPRGSFSLPAELLSKPEEAPVRTKSVEAEAREQEAKDNEKTPEELYKDALLANKISIEEAQGIIDAVMSKGFYEERFSIVGRQIVFRTRNYGDTKRISAMLEREKPQMATVANEMIAMYTLASSLVQFGPTELKHDTKEDFEAALKYIETLPSPIVYMLNGLLNKFDVKSAIVMSDGATSVF